MKQKRKRLWALFLSAALIVTQLPAVAMAENSVPEDGAIASFELLDSGVAKQTVDVGTELSGLNLPDTVMATVYHVTEDTIIPDDDNTEEENGDPSTATPSEAKDSVSGNNAGDSSTKDSGKTVMTVTTSTEEIPVTWDSEPAYDGNTEGKYVFTADVGGYVLSGSAKLPQITVTVAADTSENPTENPPAEPLSCTKMEGCTLADGHEGDCVPAPLADDSLVKTITDWKFVDDENLSEGVLALPGVSMEHQADFDTIVSMLPTQINAVIEGEEDSSTLCIPGWDCPTYIQDGDGNWPLTGEYTFAAALPEGYACEPLPTVKVLLGGANTYTNNAITQGGLTVTASDGGEVQYTEGSGFTLETNGIYEISGTWNGNISKDKAAVITVPDSVNADVMLSNTIIIVNGSRVCAFAVSGRANITLIGENTLASGHSRAGLEVPKNAAVTIGGSGSLTATGGTSAAGIGGSNSSFFESEAGSITISSGTIEAKGGEYAAGIGGGKGGSGGTTKISGGKVTAIGINRGAGIGGGDEGHSGTIIINEGSNVSAQGGEYAAGIGGGIDGDGQRIEISGGTVTATGGFSSSMHGSGAGIGGGGCNLLSDGRSGGDITISGGTVKATAGYRAAGIGGGGNHTQPGGDGGHITISGGMIQAMGNTSGAGIGGGGCDHTAAGGGAGVIEISGNAVVFATAPGTAAHIGSGGTYTDKGTASGSLTQGVVFAGEQGTVHGSVTLPGDVTIPGGSTLTVLDGSTLTIPAGTTLTNNGTVENHGIVTGGGSITNNGTVNDHSGGITVSVTGTVVNKPSKVEITFWNSQNEQITQAIYGEDITIQAKAAQKNTRLRSAAPDQIIFKTGSNELGTASVTNGTATLSLTLTADFWAAGGNTITAEYGGGSGLLPNDTGSAVLTVEKELSDMAAKITAPTTGTMPDKTATVDGSANFTVQKVTWSGALAADGSFDYNTAYTAEITLNAKQYYRFTNLVTGTINGQAASVNRISDAEAVLSYTFDKTAVQTWAVTVKNGTSDRAAAAEGETVTITAGSAPAGQTFDKWATADGVTFANENAASTTFVMPAKAVTITATYKNSGGSSSSDRSTYSEPEPQSIYTVMGNNISQTISRSDLKKLADSGKSLTLCCDKATMTFDPTALKAILAAVPATAGNITFSAAPSDLSAFPDAAKLIGNRPVYDFTISYKDSKGNPVVVPANFPAGSASVLLNFTPAAAEVTGSLFMVYVDGKGAVTWLDKSSYDNGKVLAEVPHFSTYGVAYKNPVPVFNDIANHWAKADIEFVAARGLLSGTGNNLFSPDGAMTRGMFVTALGRLAGVGPDSYQTRSFTDVKADAYYAAYVEWAAQKNIVKGTGEGLFSPDAPVTREQMAVMMVNYAGQMGYSIPTPLAAVTFADNDKISTWAAKEVAAMQRAGIIKGKDGNRFDPQASATRAEVSAVLRRFVEIVIDPATAQGWVKNDSGHWLYYQSGKALTGWQTIGKLRYFFNGDGVMHEGWKQDTSTDKWYYWTSAGAATGWREIGGKWYYFDENGVMAVNTKVDGYEVGTDGARK